MRLPVNAAYQSLTIFF